MQEVLSVKCDVCASTFQLIINEPHYHHEEKEKESDFFADCENENFNYNSEANLSEPSENTVSFVMVVDFRVNHFHHDDLSDALY